MSEPLYERIGLIGAGMARFNSETAQESTPNTDNLTINSLLGGIFAPDRPLFKLEGVSISILNAILPPDLQYPAGIIDAMVTIQGRPVSRPVYVLNQQCERVYITHSDTKGRYRAIGLDTNQHYIVLALDKPDREYNAAISDYVQPE